MAYSAEDFRVDTPPRIIGSETEYTSALDQLSNIAHRDAFIASVKRNVDTLDTSNEFAPHYSIHLPNGARLYIDGDVEEYATPECLTPIELLAHERAGEQIVQEAVWDIDTSDVPYKNVYKRTGHVFSTLGGMAIDSMSVGHHENYYMPSDNQLALLPSNGRWGNALESYLVTRSVWSGTGLVNHYGFTWSQKIDGHPTGIRIGAAIGDRQRLELINGEGNMSDWAIATKYGFTSLVLRMIEHQAFPPGLVSYTARFQNLPEIDMDSSIQLESGEIVTLYDHQKYVAQAALEFAGTLPYIPAHETKAAEDVIAVCNQIKEYVTNPDALELFSDRVDWAAKLHYMFTKGLKLSDIKLGNYAATMYDLKWEDLGTESISRQWFRNKGNVLVEQAAIEAAKVTPPNTRALARVDFIKQALSYGMKPSVEWEAVQVGFTGRVEFADPYDSKTKRIETMYTTKDGQKVFLLGFAD